VQPGILEPAKVALYNPAFGKDFETFGVTAVNETRPFAAEIR
jgi:hypothetical protein